MKLAQLISTNLEEVEEILYSQDPYSVFEDYGEFKILLLRRLQFKNENLEFTSEAFILKPTTVYYLDSQTSGFLELPMQYQSLYLQLETYYRNNQKVITAYSDQIEKLEDHLFERRIPSVFMDIWFDVKKDLSKLENYYFRNGTVYREFIKKTDSLLDPWKDEFKDIEDGIQFQTSNIATLKTRLDGVHHYFDSIKHDRLNKTLLSLTIISGIFLPLNLIVGFFGMNTPGLPFFTDKGGSEKVMLIMGGVLLICLAGIPVVNWIDHYVLRALLGRYDFYKNMSARIDDFSVRLRGK
ncbi:hypothetical protein BH10BDE1_BH10BDE1_16910 [soil metagenome]